MLAREQDIIMIVMVGNNRREGRVVGQFERSEN